MLRPEVIDRRHHQPAKDINERSLTHAGDLAGGPAIGRGGDALCESPCVGFGIARWRSDIDSKSQDGPDRVIQPGNVPWSGRRGETIYKIVDRLMTQLLCQNERIAPVADALTQIVNVVALALNDCIETQESKATIEAADFVPFLRRLDQAARN